MKATKKYLRELVEYLNSAIRLRVRHESIAAFASFATVVKKDVKATSHKEDGHLKSVWQFSKRFKCLSEDASNEKLSYAAIGGQAQVFSNAMEKLGVSCGYIEAMEVPANSVFEHFDADWKKIAVMLPSVNYNVEIGQDNMITRNEGGSYDYNKPCAQESLLFTGLPDRAADVELIAFVDWHSFPHAGELLDQFLHKVVRPSGKNDFHFLFHRSDASSKSVFEIDEMLDIISCFSTYGKVIFSLREDVAGKIWKVLNGYDPNNECDASEIPTLKEMGSAIFNTMNIERLLIYSFSHTLLVIKNHVFELEGRSTQYPVADTFKGADPNAGVCLGVLMDLPIEHCMLLGLTTMGAYLENGCKPDTLDVLEYLMRWSEETIGEGDNVGETRKQ